MSQPIPDPLDWEAPEGDSLEQRRSAVPEEDELNHLFEAPEEAIEADVAEQQLPVPDDEEYPRE